MGKCAQTLYGDYPRSVITRFLNRKTESFPHRKIKDLGRRFCEGFWNSSREQNDEVPARGKCVQTKFMKSETCLERLHLCPSVRHAMPRGLACSGLKITLFSECPTCTFSSLRRWEL